ncbi:MAG: TonB-dependent receptor [Acidobacteria bacterium]|nr:TonB-dependent receptor [Acidobacteriota bacterium]
MHTLARCLSLVVVVCAVLAVQPVHAQSSVAGEVVDFAGAPIPAVLVLIRDSAGATRRAVADEAGRFTVDDVQAGPAVVSTEAIGWDPVSLPVSLPVQDGGLRLVLRPAGIEETVVVIGTVGARQSLHPTSTDIIGSVDVLGSDQIERENVDLSYELLKKVPGVYVNDYNQGIVAGGVAIRGFNTEGDIMHTKLLIDGIPTNMNSGAALLDSIFPFDIDRIEIVKGTNDPRYGLFNIAGNLQVSTSPLGGYAKAKILGGAFGTGEFQGVTAFNTGRLSQVYFGGVRRSTGYRANSDLDRYAFSGKWFYAPASNAWQVGLIARTYDFDTQAPGYITLSQVAEDPRQSPAFSATDGGTQRTHHVSAHLDRQVTRTVAWSAKVYRQTFEQHRWVRFTAAGAQQERFEDEGQTGVLTTLTWRPAALAARDATFSWGADYQSQDNVARRFQTVNRVRGTTLRAQDFDFTNGGAYMSADVQAVRWLRLTGGVRGDRVGGEFVNGLTGRSLPVIGYGTIWQPKVSALATVREGLNLYANYGRSFQVGVGAAAFSTQPLGYSRNNGWEGGVRLAPTPWLTTRVGVWGQDASDELRLKFDNSGDSENVGKTRRRGWNIDATARAHRTTYLWGTLTRQKATLVEPGATQPQLRGNELNHVPRYTAKLGVDVAPAQAVSVSLWADIQSDYHLTTANAEGKFGDRRLVHVDALLRAHRSMTLGLHAKNIFNGYHEYAWFDGTTTLHSPGETRALYVTSTWEF